MKRKGRRAFAAKGNGFGKIALKGGGSSVKVYVVTETIYDNGNAAYDILGVYRDRDRAIQLTKLLMQVLGIAPYQQKDGVNTVTFTAEKNVFTVKEVVVD